MRVSRGFYKTSDLLVENLHRPALAQEPSGSLGPQVLLALQNSYQLPPQGSIYPLRAVAHVSLRGDAAVTAYLEERVHQLALRLRQLGAHRILFDLRDGTRRHVVAVAVLSERHHVQLEEELAADIDALLRERDRK